LRLKLVIGPAFHVRSQQPVSPSVEQQDPQQQYSGRLFQGKKVRILI